MRRSSLLRAGLGASCGERQRCGTEDVAAARRHSVVAAQRLRRHDIVRPSSTRRHLVVVVALSLQRRHAVGNS